MRRVYFWFIICQAPISKDNGAETERIEHWNGWSRRKDSPVDDLSAISGPFRRVLLYLPIHLEVIQQHMRWDCQEYMIAIRIVGLVRYISVSALISLKEWGRKCWEDVDRKKFSLKNHLYRPSLIDSSNDEQATAPSLNLIATISSFPFSASLEHDKICDQLPWMEKK